MMMDHVSVMGVDLSGMKSSRLSKKDAHYHSGHPAQNLNLILNENKELEEKKEQNPDYKDMEEWPGDRFMGVGIKKMKGYKCKLCIDELNEKRINFWDEKIKENKDWEIVQKIPK